MKLVYEHAGKAPRFPYLILQAASGHYYKVLLRHRFLFVSEGTGVLDRGRGQPDIPHVGAGRRPIGDFVYATPQEARAAFERFRARPIDALAVVSAGRKP